MSGTTSSDATTYLRILPESIETGEEISERLQSTDELADWSAVEEAATCRVESALDTLARIETEISHDTEPTDRFEFDRDGVLALDFELPTDFKLSVIIPIYNERQTICRVLGRVLSLPVPMQVIAIDDGSTDGTREILAELEAQIPQLEVIYQEQNQGKGAAVREGFRAARGTVLIVQDADMEYDPRDIPKLIEPIARGEADVVYGSRFLENNGVGSSRLHRWGNQLLTRASNCMTGWRLTDMETCYKAFRRSLLDQVAPLEQDGFGFEVELTSKFARQKARVVERPISYVARGWDEGKKIGLRDAFQAFRCIWKYR